jgi:hypothetical protein
MKFPSSDLIRRSYLATFLVGEQLRLNRLVSGKHDTMCSSPISLRPPVGRSTGEDVDRFI